VVDHAFGTGPTPMDSLEWLRQAAPRLTSLTLPAPLAFEAAQYEVFYNWPGLRSVHLSSLGPRPTGWDARRAAERLPARLEGAAPGELRSIRLGRSDGHLLAAVVAGQPALERFEATLDVHRKPDVFCRLVLALAGSCPNLRTLTLACPYEAEGRAPEVNAALAALARCRHMESLTLTYPFLADATLDAWSRGWHRLRSLLIPTAAVTDAAVARLGQRCRNLAVLNLRHCTQVTGRPFRDGRFAHCTIFR